MTEPQTSVRKLRHSIRKRAYVAFRLTAGVPGATKEQQIQVLDQQIKLLEEALEKAKQARDIVFLRDFDAHQEAKKATAEQQSITDSTFHQLISELAGEFDAKHGGFAAEGGAEGEQPEQNAPPF